MLECLEPFARKDHPKRYGLIRLTARGAREIPRRYAFAHQRLADRRHIGALAEMMYHGEWREMSLITFVWTPLTETLLLVDGQHRLLAQGQLDDDSPPMDWLVRNIVEEDPRLTYAYLDSYQKRRPPGVEGRALRFEGLSEQALTTCVAAAETVLLYDTEHEVHPRMCGRVSLPAKIAYVDHHLRSFQQVDALLQVVENRQLRRRLYGGRLQAVLVATIDRYADNAVAFWRRFLNRPERSYAPRRRQAHRTAAPEGAWVLQDARPRFRLEQLLRQCGPGASGPGPSGASPPRHDSPHPRGTMMLIPLRRLGVAVALGEQPPSLALEVGDFPAPEHQRLGACPCWSPCRRRPFRSADARHRPVDGRLPVPTGTCPGTPGGRCRPCRRRGTPPRVG